MILLKKLFYTLICIGIIKLGIDALKNSRIEHNSTRLGGTIVYNLGELKYVVGPLLICLGIYFLYKVIKLKPAQLSNEKYICPNCEIAFEKMALQSDYCENCGSKLELLNGFYERHKSSES